MSIDGLSAWELGLASSSIKTEASKIRHPGALLASRQAGISVEEANMAIVPQCLGG